jgi:hypothetical protein
MSYGIEVRSEDDVVQLSSENASLLFVDLVMHNGSPGDVYQYPELAGRSIVFVQQPFSNQEMFAVSYPGGVPRVTTVGITNTDIIKMVAFVFTL